MDAQPAAPNPDFDPTQFSGGIREFRLLQQEKAAAGK
jgi:hypothetical protein